MNRTLLFSCAVALSALAFTSCEQAQEAKNTYSAIVTTSKAAKEMANNMEAAQERQEDRKQRGDTMALPYKELQKYLPASPEGHTDNVGDPAKNQQLSEARVQEVKRYLVSRGIDEKRISLIGFGGSKPRFDNSREETRKLNRRVEMLIVK